ncbi:hypothetical protein BDZ88DRAFT_475894 [Geranomyces variabilis]|nr:hypothetical protein BDZ88DRAFT_475894 [Geranomyces variabilis]KAJ3140185.1 hypothetical protein HDU90_008409 [Geranomyces variabilis]
MELNITECVLDRGVQAFFEAQAAAAFQAAVRDAADSAAYAYGGPGVIVGVCWPLVVVATVISTWRLRTKPSWRSGLLFIGVILNIFDVANLTTAKMTSPWILLGTSWYAYAYPNMLIVSSQSRMGIMFTASSWRLGSVIMNPRLRKLLIALGSVIMNPRLRKLLIASMGIVGMGQCIANMAVGIININKYKEGGKVYWGMASMALPTAYSLLGLAVFTRTLRKAQRAVYKADGDDDLAKLQFANNVLMAMSIIAAVTLTAVGQSIDSQTNPYLIPVAFLLATLWTLLENMFEVVAIVLRVAAFDASSISNIRAASGTGGGGGAVPSWISAPNDVVHSAWVDPKQATAIKHST